MSSQHPEALLMKAVDGLLTEGERRQLDEHLAACAACREELQDFGRIKETTDAMTARILRDASIEPPRVGRGGRRVIGAGWLAVLIGALLLVGFGGYRFATDPDAPLVVKLAVALLALGCLFLLGYVLRIRLGARGRDPYEEIDQ